MVRNASPASARKDRSLNACARPEDSSGSGGAPFLFGVRLSRLVSGSRVKMLRNLLALRQIAGRTITTASRRQFENKVAEKQKLFQEDNGIPVHLKGGIADALLYRATMVLTVGGTMYALYQLAMASFPKKQD